MHSKTSKEIVDIYHQAKDVEEFTTLMMNRFPIAAEAALSLWEIIDLAWLHGYNRHRETFQELNKGRLIQM